VDTADAGLDPTGVARSPFGAIILAGGRSSRLGFDKALLKVNGVPLVQWLPGRLAEFFSAVAVVVDRPQRYATPWPQVTDTLPNHGPLAGIAAGLQATTAPASFVCACDMPLLHPALLRLLCSLLAGHDLVIPQRDGRLEPLCAVYAASCLPVIQRLLRQGRLRANGVAGEVHARILQESEWQVSDPQGDSFLNINSPGDLPAMQLRATQYGLRLTP
jgi:molybdopterin-guanine dinucleotide biosynthesis protein A